MFAWLGLAAALAGPPPLRDEEPRPWPRGPELSRKSVELLPQARVSLPTCQPGAGRASCDGLGPSVGGEVIALYRPSPYFAFGASAGYSVAHGALDNAGSTSAKTLSLGMVGRVYLLESGAFDPYLEALIGWGSTTTTVAFQPRSNDSDSAAGPLGRAGGGVDWMLSPSVKLGVTVAFTQLFLARGQSCRAAYCSSGWAPGGTVSGGLAAGLELGVLLGDTL